MLEMGTGGGEWLSPLRASAPVHRRHRKRPPNVNLATIRLGALRDTNSPHGERPDNPDQDSHDPTGRLLFRTNTFDPITNRRESFLAGEVAQVLRLKGTFITQQAHLGSEQFRKLLGVEPPEVQSNPQKYMRPMSTSRPLICSYGQLGPPPCFPTDITSALGLMTSKMVWTPARRS
jgi:hypothetical protein